MYASFQGGLRVLLRSAACMCQHYMHAHERPLSPQLSPFGWLPLVHEASQGGGDLARLAAARGIGGRGGAAAVHASFVDSEGDDEDWDVVSVRSSRRLCCLCYFQLHTSGA